MTRRLATAIALIVLALGGAVLATATAQTTLVVKAVDPPDAATNAWDPGLPDVLEAEVGDTVSWEFDQARTIHNLFLMRAGGEELHLSAEPVCSGPLGLCSPPPDHPDPIQFTFEVEGEYTYYCTVHGGDAEGNGMAGRIVVGDPGGGGGPNPLPNPSGPPTELDTCPGGCGPVRGR
jgi:plastocyanin